jgi:hypothetical protein
MLGFSVKNTLRLVVDVEAVGTEFDMNSWRLQEGTR